MRIRWAIAVLAVCGGCGVFGHRAQPADPLAVVEALRAGGYVLYLRHGETGGGDDQRPVVLEDCATQRNLSDAGRAEARAIGAGFERLLIPVGEVRASPYCRCAETARLAFDRVLLDGDLATLSDADAAQRAARIAALQHLLAVPPPAGTNTVLVSHSDNWNALHEPALEPGEVAVVKPLGSGYQLITRVPAGAWATMPDPGVR